MNKKEFNEYQKRIDAYKTLEKERDTLGVMIALLEKEPRIQFSIFIDGYAYTKDRLPETFDCIRRSTIERLALLKTGIEIKMESV